MIWAFTLGAQVMYLWMLYWIKSELFQYNPSEPFIGEHYIAVPLALLFMAEELLVSFFRRRHFLKAAVAQQDPELVQKGLIFTTANVLSISLCGWFLGWFLEYPYFYIWILVGILATIIYFPKRRHLENAR